MFVPSDQMQQRSLPLTIGKMRGLQACSTERGALSVLALDHRNNLRGLLHPENPAEATIDEMVAFKVELVRWVAPAASAVLLDPEWSAAQSVAAGALPGGAGLVLAIEATGYSGDPAARQSRVLPGWSVEKSKRMGASAVKLLVYYHPDAPTAGEIEDLVRDVAEQCLRADLALFLEPLSYSLDPQRKKLPPDERRYVVLETARRLSPLGADILKAEFPLDVAAEPDERAWAAACRELGQASVLPWILLSASAEYETYLRQTAIACLAGASGVAAGRAVWKEATSLPTGQRPDFYRQVACERMRRLTELCQALARPWTEFWPAAALTAGWYLEYA